MRTLVLSVLGLSLGLASVAIDVHAFTLMKAGLRGWNTKTLAFRWNPTGCGIDEALFERALGKALAAWNSAPSSALKLEYAGRTSTTLASLRDKSATDSPALVCNTAFVTDYPSDAAMTGYGYAEYLDGVGPRIDFGYVELNSQTGASGHLAELPEDSLALLLTHEIGHVLGLGHTQDSSSVMSYDRKYYGDPLLAGDDMDAMSFLYPRDELGGDGVFGCGTIGGVDRRGGGGPIDRGGGASAAVGLAQLGLWLFLPLLLLRLRWLPGLHPRRLNA